ncbi:hypothetical protein FRB97_005167 [Tulasnella sp. 331]|nr:hypothetical protein FRB97_005167 [Tulasnella sp. 331]
MMDVNDLFRQARRDLEMLYEAMHPGSSRYLRDQFIEELHDAESWDRVESSQSLHWKGRKPASLISEGENLTTALNTATIDVTLFIVEAKPITRGPILLRCNGETSKFHKTLRLQGLIFKLIQDGVIDQRYHDYQFYERREGKHRLTSQGVVFEALSPEKMLATVARQASPLRSTLELFLILTAKGAPFAIITRGNPKRHPSAEPDVGEVVMKVVDEHKPRVLGGPGDTYQERKTRASKRHEDLEWDDMANGQWVLARPWDSEMTAKIIAAYPESASHITAPTSGPYLVMRGATWTDSSSTFQTISAATMGDSVMPNSPTGSQVSISTLASDDSWTSSNTIRANISRAAESQITVATSNPSTLEESYPPYIPRSVGDNTSCLSESHLQTISGTMMGGSDTPTGLTESQTPTSTLTSLKFWHARTYQAAASDPTLPTHPHHGSL